MLNRICWTARARTVGVASGLAILVIGILYVAVIVIWLIVEATPLEPIGDPYLAIMEVLTLLSATSLIGLVVALHSFTDSRRRGLGIATLTVGVSAAIVTACVHFVQLTAVRQMWRSGLLADYRLVWPSVIFAVEYFAWDVLVGTTMILAAQIVVDKTTARILNAGGLLCLVGVLGPLTGLMYLQNISVAGYAVAFPIASGMIARLFLRSSPSVHAAS